MPLNLLGSTTTAFHRFEEGMDPLCGDQPGSVVSLSPAIKQYNQEMEAATKKLCACSLIVPSKVNALAAPSILGMFAVFLSVIISASLCQAMACCKSYANAMEEGGGKTEASSLMQKS